MSNWDDFAKRLEHDIEVERRWAAPLESGGMTWGERLAGSSVWTDTTQRPFPCPIQDYVDYRTVVRLLGRILAIS